MECKFSRGERTAKTSHHNLAFCSSTYTWRWLWKRESVKWLLIPTSYLTQRCFQPTTWAFNAVFSVSPILKWLKERRGLPGASEAFQTCESEGIKFFSHCWEEKVKKTHMPVHNSDDLPFPLGRQAHMDSLRCYKISTALTLCRHHPVHWKVLLQDAVPQFRIQYSCHNWGVLLRSFSVTYSFPLQLPSPGLAWAGIWQCLLKWWLCTIPAACSPSCQRCACAEPAAER